MTQEIFKDIEGYERLYQVSNLGKVKSLNYLRTGKKKILKPAIDKDGYLCVILHKNGKRKLFKVHRLVAQAFIPNPNNLLEVNHKDEVKTNNHVENLEWCTHEYNNNYGTRNERVAKALSKLLKGKYNTKISKAVIQYDKKGNFIKEYPSSHEVQRQLGYSNGNISYCCNGKYKSAYGYIWRYKN